MARPGRFDHLKPEVFRLFAEGMKPREILKQFTGLPSSTVYDWQKEFRNISGISGQARDKMPIDPESPLEKIINALWDLHAMPTQDGAGIMVQVLNALLRAEQVRAAQFAVEDMERLSDAELAKIANGG